MMYPNQTIGGGGPNQTIGGGGPNQTIGGGGFNVTRNQDNNGGTTGMLTV